MSSGGAQSLCILSTYPYHGYCVVGLVTGAPTGLWGDIKDPCPMAWDKRGKGVSLNFSNTVSFEIVCQVFRSFTPWQGGARILDAISFTRFLDKK